MPRLDFLSELEKTEFDSPPELTDDLREQYFVKYEFDSAISQFRKEETAVAYILLRGYFLITGKFFQPHQFRKGDIDYVSEILEIKKDLQFENYHKSTYTSQKAMILNHFGFRRFKDFRQSFEDETHELVKTDLKPKQIFHVLVRSLQEKKVEIPSYYVFSETISNSLNDFENTLLTLIDSKLSSEQKRTLDEIMNMAKNVEENVSPSNPYLITTIKKPEQELATGKIKESLNDFKIVASIYEEFDDILNELSLSDQLLNYYAVWLIKSAHIKFLSISDPSKKYLYILSFIIYQYRIRQDLFVDTYIKSIQKFQNDVERSISDDFINQKPVQVQQTRKVIDLVKSLSEHVDSMRRVTFSGNHSDSQKIDQIKRVFQEIDETRGAKREKLNQELEKLEQSISSGLKDQLQLENSLKNFIKLKNKVGGILKILDFNENSSDQKMIEAIKFYRSSSSSRKDQVHWPLEFLNQKEQKSLKSPELKDSFRLYQIYLFVAVSNHIKAGSLNLNNSDKYRAVEDYLIPEKSWAANKGLLLERAALPIESECNNFISRISVELDKQYVTTNSNIIENEHLSFTKAGKPRLVTPKVDKEELGGLAHLLEEQNVLPLAKILLDVNTATNFLSQFVHFSKKNFQKAPDERSFLAAIIALGCNIGIGRMGKISKGINSERLSYLVQWYFSKENLDNANDLINASIGDLSLPSVYQNKENKLHTSSDGQKFNVTVPSIIASHSFKYFGSGKGITAYSFIDEHSRLFYNNVISASEREAAYVIDGLMHNDDIESDIHSTDTHGYSEIVFGITNCLGVFFAPRIKNYRDQLLYTFKINPKKIYEKEGFTIRPTANTYIDTDLLVSQWDKVLRVLASIKLRETTASRILKRLSSYSKQHPLYRALKHVGRIYKSIFLLKYIDEVELRQSTEKALNRIEQSHQFAKAIFFGNNQEFKIATKEEQEIAVGARHLIQNVIVLWNYLKLTEKLTTCNNQKEFEKIINTVKNSSIMTWQHINMHGEYDFDLLKIDNDTVSFEMDRLLSLKL